MIGLQCVADSCIPTEGNTKLPERKRHSCCACSKEKAFSRWERNFPIEFLPIHLVSLTVDCNLLLII